MLRPGATVLSALLSYATDCDSPALAHIVRHHIVNLSPTHAADCQSVMLLYDQLLKPVELISVIVLISRRI